MVRPGDKISERYEVLEQLAVGGMGSLWRARHLELEVDVALKVILAEVATPLLIKRFKHEAQAAARLRSPNIVHVLDYGVFEQQPYLIMELLRGEDLAARLVRTGKLPPTEALAILAGMANGLMVAHEAGVVHRDLKPANVFLEKVAEQEVVKILDFGVAKDLRHKTDPIDTTSSGAVGSPAYMSPEQVWGEPVGAPADLWAMAAVAFEMLTGKAPFADKTLAKVFERIIRAPLPSAGDFAPELPPSLDGFFARALARPPAERFGSARELVEMLGQALAGEAAMPARRKALPWLLVAGLGGLGLVAVLRGRISDSAPAVARPVAVVPAVQPTAQPATPQDMLAVVSAGATPSAAPAVNEAAKRRAASASAVRSASPLASAPAVDPEFGIPLPR